MSKVNCPCGRPMPGDGTICRACLADLERALGDAPWAAAQLTISYSRQSRIGSGDGGRRSADTPMPYDARSSKLATDLRTTLARWAGTIAQQVGESLEGPMCDRPCRHRSCKTVRGSRTPSGRTADLARWMLCHLELIRRHQAAGRIADDITRLIEAAERCIDRPADLAYSGPCDECDLDLYGRLGASLVRCRGCGAQYDVTERREWLLAAAEDTLAHAALIARALSRLGTNIQANRLYVWANRGQILAHGTDTHGRPLYRIGDVLDLLARMEAKTTKASA